MPISAQEWRVRIGSFAPRTILLYTNVCDPIDIIIALVLNAFFIAYACLIGKSSSKQGDDGISADSVSCGYDCQEARNNDSGYGGTGTGEETRIKRDFNDLHKANGFSISRKVSKGGGGREWWFTVMYFVIKKNYT